ncbi:hypothetical protein NMD97_09780 [Edwardsiella tarda]
MITVAAEAPTTTKDLRRALIMDKKMIAVDRVTTITAEPTDTGDITDPPKPP